MQEEMLCLGQRYEIQEGDTLYSISRREQIPIDWIMQANPMVDPYMLQVGDWICIPKVKQCTKCKPNGGNQTVIRYVTREGETLEQILDKFDIGIEELLKYNGLHGIVLQKGCILKIPKKTDD